MNSLKKLYESFSNTKFFGYFQDVVAQTLLFAIVTVGLSLWCLLEYGELTYGNVIIMSVFAIIFFVCLILLIYKKWFLFPFCISLLITLFCLYVHHELFGGFLKSVVFSLACFLIPACNIFVWHFQNQHDGCEKISMRVFVLLTINILVSLLFAWTFMYFSEYEIIVSPLFFFCATMAYVFFRILYERKNLSAKGCQKDTTICNKRSTSYYDAILNVYYVLYVVFFSAILTGITANDLYISRHYDSLIDQAPEYIEAHTLALYFAVLYFLLWGISIIANSKSLLSKICSAFSAFAAIPICFETINHIQNNHIRLGFDYVVHSCYEAMGILTHQENINLVRVNTMFGAMFGVTSVLIVVLWFYKKKVQLAEQGQDRQAEQESENSNQMQ